ncbi:MAG: hypothetical protein HWN67_16740 [Candidatus Helarchaeota archaeon]|nr:hypothetical protein [Candidatus Helarchaeota archaeon]
MIDKIYIMYNNGVCVFEKIYYTSLETIKTDSQLFTGFLTAIGGFAAEALGSGLQSIHLQTGEQLAIMRHESTMIGICIADGRDHEKLISSLLKKILDRFYQIFKREIDIMDASLLGKTDKFDKEVELILKNKASSRANWKMGVGILIGFGLLALLTIVVLNRTILQYLPGPLFLAIVYDPLYILFFNSIGSSIGAILSLIMFFVAILFFIPSVFAGFLSGNRNRGLFAGIIITIIAYLTLILATVQIKANLGVDLKGWFLSLSPLIFFLTLSVSYCAGYIAERKYLYSFPEQDKKVGKLESVLKSIKEKIGL